MEDIQVVPVGFVEDVKNLVLEFVEKDTTDFTVFKGLWHSHNFSSIFRGRDEREINHFTQEIFQLTLKFLDNTSDLYKISCIYILYCLYQAQLLIPRMKIRLTLSHSSHIKDMQKAAIENNHKHLLCIIEFLYKEAFEYVAFSTLHGPRSLHFQKEAVYKPDFSASLFNEARKEMLDIYESHSIENIRKFARTYTNLKAPLYPRIGIETTVFFAAEFESLKKDLDKLIYKPKTSSQKTTDIGLRRTLLKAAAFEHRSRFRESIFSSDPDESEEEKTQVVLPKKKPIIRRRRVPLSERRVGRPTKALVEARFKERLEAPKPQSPIKKKRRGAIGRPPQIPTASDDELHEEKPLSLDQILLMSDSSSEEEKEEIKSEVEKEIKSEVEQEVKNEVENETKDYKNEDVDALLDDGVIAF